MMRQKSQQGLQHFHTRIPRIFIRKYIYWKLIIISLLSKNVETRGISACHEYFSTLKTWRLVLSSLVYHKQFVIDTNSICIIIGARLMHVGDSSIYLNWLLENIYNKVPNSNSVKNYELF